MTKQEKILYNGIINIKGIASSVKNTIGARYLEILCEKILQDYEKENKLKP